MNIDINQFDLFGIALGISVGVNVLFWVPASIFKTEKFYDLVGSLTFITLTIFSLLSREIRTRQLIVSCLVLAWALRLGSFLFWRVLTTGEDKRFAELKLKPLRFLVPWMLQAIWVWTTLLAVLILNFQNVDHFERAINWADILGWATFAIGFAVEVTADLQKIVWRRNPENKGKWIASGLWYYSRHPNYFGEVTLWTGVFVACAANFQGAEFVGVISPIFSFALIYFVSGVPLLEKYADNKWGDDPNYVSFKANTSIFVPLPHGCCAGSKGTIEREEALHKGSSDTDSANNSKRENSEAM